MSQATEVSYFETIKIILDFLRDKKVPFQLMNIQREDGTIEAAGIRFENARWDKDNVLVKVDSRTSV